MTALSTSFERLFLAVGCVLSWMVFPLFIVAGGMLLLGCAVIAELFSMMVGAATPVSRDGMKARRTAERLCGLPRP